MKLDLFWRKVPVTLKTKLGYWTQSYIQKYYMVWKHLSYHKPAMITSTHFKSGSSEKPFHLKHSYWAHVTNDAVMNTANNRAQYIDKDIGIIPLSFKLNKESSNSMGIPSEATPTQIK